MNTTTVYLTWMTGFAQFFSPSSDPLPPPPLASVAVYGTQPGSLSQQQAGTSNYYIQVRCSRSSFLELCMQRAPGGCS